MLGARPTIRSRYMRDFSEQEGKKAPENCAWIGYIGLLTKSLSREDDRPISTWHVTKRLSNYLAQYVSIMSSTTYSIDREGVRLSIEVLRSMFNCETTFVCLLPFRPKHIAFYKA